MRTHPAARKAAAKEFVPVLLTANQIATRLGRSTRSVIDKLKSLNIQADSDTGHFKLYRPEVTENVRAAMRKPNKPSTSTGA